MRKLVSKKLYFSGCNFISVELSDGEFTYPWHIKLTEKADEKKHEIQ